MATTIRPELSEKNPYWIEKHRYYELKHFCLQYPIWRKAYSSLSGISGKPSDWAMFIVTSTLGDPTAKVGIARAYYSERTDMIERVAEQTDQQLAPYILKAVTEGWSYDILKELAQMVEHWIVISKGQGFESLTILFYFFFQVRRRCRKCPVKNLS